MIKKKKEEVIEEPIKEVFEEKKCGKIDELGIAFNTEGMNKVVEKINEVIKKLNGC